LYSRQRPALLQLLARRIEVNSNVDVIGDLFADGVVVHFENDLRTRQHQLAAVGTHDFALLSNSPFHEQSAEESATRGSTIGRRSEVQFWIFLLQSCQSVVRNF